MSTCAQLGLLPGERGQTNWDVATLATEKSYAFPFYFSHKDLWHLLHAFLPYLLHLLGVFVSSWLTDNGIQHHFKALSVGGWQDR